MRPITTTLLASALLALLAGCATTSTADESPEAPYTFASESYDEVFNRAIRTLRDAHFTIDRVDAREGVITTRPSPSAGFATPWREHAMTADESWLNLVHQEQRVAAITFSPADQQERPEDFREFRGDFQLAVRVYIERYARTAKKHDASGVRFLHFSTGRRSGESLDDRPVRTLTREDTALATTILRHIQSESDAK